MRLLKQEKFNKKLSEPFEYKFEIEESGLYAIEITASCKSWQQNLIKFISFFKDDDLSVKIDDIEFPKQNGRGGLFDGEVAWNGNGLKGLKKTDIFLINLEKGNHTIKFLIDQKPYLEDIKIYSIKDENFEIEESQAESGDRRPWFIFILVNLPLKTISAVASALKYEKDDDDLKLIINGKIQENTEPKSHKYWYWCGRNLKGKSKEFNKEINLSQGLHYVEFWADRMPVLHKIVLDLEEKTLFILKNYTYTGVNGNEDYNRYDTIIKEVVDYWNNEFLKDTNPPEKILDPNLVKAMIYQESRVGYYPGAEINVIQVGNTKDPALRTLKGELKEYWIHNGKQVILEYPGVKIESVKDSIYWGVRWLYHKAQGITTDGGRYWRTWKEAVYQYGPGTKEYTNSVWHIYKNGIKKENNNIIRLWAVVLILLLPTFLLFGQNAISGFDKLTTSKTNTLENLVMDSFTEEERLQIQDIEIGLYKDSASPFWAVIEWEKDWWEKLKIGALKDEVIKWLKIENSPDEQSILSARFIDLEGFSNPILEVYGKTHTGNGSLYLYEVKDNKILSIFENMATVDSYNENVWSPENYQNYGYTTCGQVYEGGKLSAMYSDINGDGISDIFLEGKANIICEKKKTTIKVSEQIINKIYLWDKNEQKFVKSI